jgi:tRNA (guanosine-2'-O-)-methyltransferase
MYGFTESFNISVSVSLCLFHFTSEIRSVETDWRLTEEEKLEIYLQWFRNTTTNSEMIERKFYQDYLAK